MKTRNRYGGLTAAHASQAFDPQAVARKKRIITPIKKMKSFEEVF